MRSSSRYVIALAICLAILPCAGRAGVKPTEASCRAFVQGFYDWYLKATQNKSFDVAIKSRKSSFSPVLVAELRADLEASSKEPNEIVGLDFDPVLNSQDPAEKYVAKKVTRTKNTFRVEVFGKGVGGDDRLPAVVPMLEYRRDHWVFTNFIYPGGPGHKTDDHLSILKELRDARKAKKKTLLTTPPGANPATYR
jgi:hypothetical protein